MQGDLDGRARVVGGFVADEVGDEARDFHVVEPLHELGRVGQARLAPVGVELVTVPVVEAGEPSGVEDDDVVLLDRDTLRLGSGEEVIQAHGLATLESFLAAVPGDVDEHAATDDAPLGERQHRGLGERTLCRGCVVAVVDDAVVPDVSERIDLGRALQKHLDLVVGVVVVTSGRTGLPALEEAFVHDRGTHRRLAVRPHRVAVRLGQADGNLQRERLARLDGRDTSQHLRRGEVVEATHLVVGPPLAPVLGRVVAE